jgi:hypothetical protein
MSDVSRPLDSEGQFIEIWGMLRNIRQAILLARQQRPVVAAYW